MRDKGDTMVAGVLAALAADLAVMDRHEPWDMARVAGLADDASARAAISDLLFSIVPDRVDGEQWTNWLQGGQPPQPRPLRNPDSGPRPHARGAMLGAKARHDAAAAQVASLEAKLADARGELARARADLERAHDQVRTVVVYRLMTEIGRQASAIPLGPLYTLARAISPYFQHDAAFEAGLDDGARELLAERRRTREKDSREILDLLDRYASDPGVELRLHRMIRQLLREAHAEREAENAEARAAGKPLPAANKRRAVRRSSAEQQRGVHPAAIRSDAPNVFAAYPDRSDTAAADADPATDRKELER